MDRSRAHMTPPPAAVRYNDWRRIPVAPPDAFTPARPVSVILACHAEQRKLDLLLAALERQTWPGNLFEVVVVDDGSEPPLETPRSTPLDVKVVRQERHGFGGARVRNAGVRAAAHDILLFLDGDMLPEAGWLSAHARWHHAAGDLITLGPRTGMEVEDVDARAIRERPGSLRELFAGRPTDPESRVRSHLDRTRDLTSRDDTPFLVMVGANFGVGRALFERVGGVNESFRRCGPGDTEFAWRAWNHGAVFVPVPEAFARHQGRPDIDSPRKLRSHRRERVPAAHLIAHESMRDARPGCVFAVPRYVVTVHAGDLPAERVAGTVDTVLADREHDLVVRIELPPDEDRREWLRDRFGPDPRVRVAPSGAALDEFPATPFHVTLPAGVRPARGVVHRLHTYLGSAVSATCTLPDGSAVSMTRAWALQRARRTARPVADFGDVVTVSARRLRVANASGVRGRRLRHDPVGRVLGRAARIRTPRQAWWFLTWLSAGLLRLAGWRIRTWTRCFTAGRGKAGERAAALTGNRPSNVPSPGVAARSRRRSGA